MACLNDIRYHGVLLGKFVVDDWLSVGTWFGILRVICSVYTLILAQTPWFGIFDVCSANVE